jgi:hypothetical protein
MGPNPPRDPVRRSFLTRGDVMHLTKAPWKAMVLAPVALALLLSTSWACNRGGSRGGSVGSPGLLQQQLVMQQMMLQRQQTMQQLSLLTSLQQRQLATQQYAVLAASLQKQQTALQKALDKTTATLTALEQKQQGTPTAADRQQLVVLRKKQTRLETALEKTTAQLKALQTQGALTTPQGR